MPRILFLTIIFSIFFTFGLQAQNLPNENGYDVWLRYKSPENQKAAKYYQELFASVYFASEENPVLKGARFEIDTACLLTIGKKPGYITKISRKEKPSLVIGTSKQIGDFLKKQKITIDAGVLGPEGFQLSQTEYKGKKCLVLTAAQPKGLLYGTFYLLKRLRLGDDPYKISHADAPKTPMRMTNHWDNLNRFGERLYGGWSVFDYRGMPEYHPRLRDYCRIHASLGINAICINNVNTWKGGWEEGWKLLRPDYLHKLTILSRLFDEYGIKLFISAPFVAPIIFGDVKTADPIDVRVQNWWKNKCQEIKDSLPAFGGFLIKADSEGEIGPLHYNRSQAQGANMLAEALKPVGGCVVWRAFIYGDPKKDRALEAFEAVGHLDGAFAENAILQIKYGPLDFQADELVSSLFTQMDSTNLMMELQITQEYTGNQKHVCNLTPFWKYLYDFDTYLYGPDKPSPIKEVISTSPFGNRFCGVAGVSNVCDQFNWTGQLLAQANLFGYGRLAWNPDRQTDEILKEYAALTFGKNDKVVSAVSEILGESYDIYTQYHWRYGLAHMGWMNGYASDRNPDRSRPKPQKYEGRYHQTDAKGTGYDRTMKTGTGYTAQYPEPLRSLYENPKTCPEKHILSFHKLPYTWKMKSGKTLIQTLYDDRFTGVERAKQMRKKWLELEGLLDDERFYLVLRDLNWQISEANICRDVIVDYFYKKSGIKDEKGRTLINPETYFLRRYTNYLKE